MRPAVAIAETLLGRALAWLKFLCSFRGVVIFAGFCTPEREREGFFQRVRAVDLMLADLPRVYVDHIFPPAELPLWEEAAPKVHVLRVGGGFWRKNLGRLMVWLLALKGRRLYFHSIWQMNLNRFGRFLRVPGLRCFFDAHGAVTEEMRLRSDFYHATLFDPWERLAVRRAALTVVVTERLGDFFKEKYRDEAKSPRLVLPIMPDLEPETAPRPDEADSRPVAVYAGSLHAWQLAEETLELMAATRESFRHHFFCPDPEAAARLAPAGFRPGADFVLDSLSPAEVLAFLPGCVYGFALRDDHIVNRVACPTKIMEYMALGVIPVLKSPHIGDFVSLGLAYVSAGDFRAGRLPDAAARADMRQRNVDLYLRLREQYHHHSRALKDMLTRD